MLEKMDSGSIWVKDNKGGKENKTGGGERMEGVEKGNAKDEDKDGELMEGVEKTAAKETISTSSAVATKSTAPMPDDDPASQQLLNETRASELKRKSHAADNGERKKAVKVTDNERAFIGNALVKEADISVKTRARSRGGEGAAHHLRRLGRLD